MREGNIEKVVSSKIKVIQLLPELEEGGVEKGTLEIGSYLVKHGNKSIVISAGGRMAKTLKKNGSIHITHKYVGEKSPRSLIHLPMIRNILLKEKPDILHLRSRLPAWIGYIAYKSIPRKIRPKLVTTFHGFYSVNKYSAIMTKGEKIIAVSKTISEHIKKEYHIPDHKIEIIYRGVGDEYLNSDEIETKRLDHLKDKWKISDKKKPLLLLPARLTRLKGHKLFIESLSSISGLDWTAVFVGDADEKSDYIKELQNMIKNSNLTDRIIFAGYCGDMPAAVKLADIVVSASIEPEAFGRTMIEAQAVGTPVIAPAHGGSLETIIDGYTGWLFKPGDVKSLSYILKKAVSNKNEREKLGGNGKKTIKEKFTTKKMCESTLTLYKKLISEK